MPLVCDALMNDLVSLFMFLFGNHAPVISLARLLFVVFNESFKCNIITECAFVFVLWRTRAAALCLLSSLYPEL